ncbi:MAG: hypothetical protein ACUVRV_13080 [Cyanobacteriota bacterium]
MKACLAGSSGLLPVWSCAAAVGVRAFALLALGKTAPISRGIVQALHHLIEPG